MHALHALISGSSVHAPGGRGVGNGVGPAVGVGVATGTEQQTPEGLRLPLQLRGSCFVPAGHEARHAKDLPPTVPFGQGVPVGRGVGVGAPVGVGGMVGSGHVFCIQLSQDHLV